MKLKICNKKSLLAIIGFMLLSTATSVASAENYYLKIVNNNNETSSFIVSDKLSMTFKGESMTVSNSNKKVTFKFDDIKSIVYHGNDTGVNDITPDQPSSIQFLEDMILLTPPTANNNISHELTIYNLKGNIVKKEVFDNPITISFSEFNQGVYILNVDFCKPIKFIVK